MMTKLFCNSNRDYKTTLRRRMWMLVGCGLVGILMLVLSLYAFPKDMGHAQEFVRGFYSGCGTGLIAIAVIFLIRTGWLLKHDKARRTAQIKETDERQQQINMHTFSTASMICFWVNVVALVISAPLNFTVFVTLLVEFWVSVIVGLVTNLVYQRRL